MKNKKFNLSTIFLIIAIILIITMGGLLYIQKNDADRQIYELENNATKMQETISDLQEKIYTISNTINSDKTPEVYNTQDSTEKTFYSVKKDLEVKQENEKKSIFEEASILEYTTNMKDDINGKIAILKMGEDIFKTKIEKDYYTYIDNFSNSYQIKEITEINSEFFMMGIDDWAGLYKCTINYIDNIDTPKEIIVAVILPKDKKDAYIMTPFDNYTGSTSFVRSFAGNIVEE